MLNCISILIIEKKISYFLQDLSQGVREVCILVNRDIVYEGEVDKGCGNQVFDYGFNVRVTDSDSPRSDNSSSTPAIDNVSLFQSTEYTHRDSHRDTHRDSVKKTPPQKDIQRDAQGDQIDGSKHTPRAWEPESRPNKDKESRSKDSVKQDSQQKSKESDGKEKHSKGGIHLKPKVKSPEEDDKPKGM